MVKLPETAKSTTGCVFVIVLVVVCFSIHMAVDDTVFEIDADYYADIWGGNPPVDAPAPPARLAPVCGVYFFQCGQFVKIGISRDVARRIKQTRTFLPVELRLAALIECSSHDLLKMESELHRRFDTHRVRGEWFRLESPLTEFIASIARFRPENADRPPQSIETSGGVS